MVSVVDRLLWPDLSLPIHHTDRSEVYYWESIVLARKFLIVLVVVFLAQIGVSMQVWTAHCTLG
jgi:hypothetical protein